MESISSKQVIKLGIIVDDVEEAAKYYAKLFGMEVPKVSVPAPESSVEINDSTYTWYKGSDKKPRCKVTKVNTGPVYLELIEPLPDVPNPFTDFKDKYGQGVYFISFYIEGFGEHIEFMEDLGMPMTLNKIKVMNDMPILIPLQN